MNEMIIETAIKPEEDLDLLIRGLRDIDIFIAGRLEHKKAKKFLRTIDETIALLKAQEATIQILVNDITFHNCNNCNRKDCENKPNAGQPVRSNCIYWLEGQ